MHEQLWKRGYNLPVGRVYISDLAVGWSSGALTLTKVISFASVSFANGENLSSTCHNNELLPQW